MDTNETNRQADTYWQSLINKARPAEMVAAAVIAVAGASAAADASQVRASHFQWLARQEVPVARNLPHLRQGRCVPIYDFMTGRTTQSCTR